nr:MAG TPA: hypothetical protein [Caudoviricetes sp.]
MISKRGSLFQFVNLKESGCIARFLCSYNQFP